MRLAAGHTRNKCFMSRPAGQVSVEVCESHVLDQRSVRTR